MSKILFLITLSSLYFAKANYTASIPPLNNCLGKRKTKPTTNCDNDLALFLNSASTTLKKLVKSTKTESEVAAPRRLISGLSSALLNPSASSFSDTASGAYRARFDFTNSEGQAAWCCSSNDPYPYFQASSPIPHEFDSILMRAGYSNNWILTFNLWYTLDGANWISYQDNALLNGNTDGTNTVTIKLVPFIARAVRISLISRTHGASCSKIEFQIYRIFYDPIPYDHKNLIAALASGANTLMSSVNSSTITESNLLFDYSSSYPPSAWCSATNNQNQWVIISTGLPVKWERVSFMKRNYQLLAPECVTKVRFEYTVDGELWENYNNGKVSGLGDCKTLAITTVELKPFVAISIKIIPVEWVTKICMKVEAYYSLIS